MVALLGQRDAFLKLIESAFDCEILVRGNEITISGPPAEAERVGSIFEELLTLLERGNELSDSAVGEAIQMIKGGNDDGGTPLRASEVLGDKLLTARGKGITPKTIGQKRYVDAIRSSTVTFAIGPAGTGKTYLAVATAVRALQEHAGLAAHPHAAGRRGRRAPRLLAGHALREDRPVHASALRRAVRDDRRRHPQPADGARNRRGRAPGFHAWPRATVLAERAHADGVRPDRESRRRRPGRRIRRPPDARPRRVSAGAQAGLPREHPGRSVHAVLRRTPVGGLDAGGQAPWQACPYPRDARDDREAPWCAQPSIRTPAPLPSGRVRAAGDPDGRVRARAAPRRRMHHHVHHTLVLHR